MNPISLTKRYKCAHCTQPFVKERLGQKVCGVSCAKMLVETNNKKKAAKAAKIDRAITREKLKAFETLPKLKKQLKTALHAYIRARDYGQPCISCNKPLAWGTGKTGGVCDAGHYRSVGSAAHLRFVEDNINAQCKHCNKQLAGNAAGYRLGLIKRIGLARVESLEADNEPRKYTHEQLRQMTVGYKQKLKANKCK